MQRRNLYIEKHYNPAYHKAFIAYLRYGTAITVPYYVIKAASPEHYIWRTQEDNKVRLTHAANNGKVFTWNKPPATGHPGQERNCRCWTEPVMVIIEDLSKVEALIKMTDSKTWPEPPINGILTEDLASKTKPRNRKEKSLYDQYGGEWRPHIDRRHNTHWDYKASGRCSEWLNIPINNLPILKEGWQYVKNEMFSRVQRSNYASNSWR